MTLTVRLRELRRLRPRRRPLRVAVLVVALALALAGGPVAPAAAAPDDPGYDDQWGLHIVDAEEAWQRGTGEGTTIAIVDTGVALDHPDLAANVVAHVSCIGADDDPSRCSGSGRDDHGHGTHVAGIAAAVTANGRGVAGTAPRAGIMSVRVLERDDDDDDDDDGEATASGELADVRAGIRWAVDHGADVVNLSLGRDIFLPPLLGLGSSGLESAIEYAWEHGVVTVIASGNSNRLFGSGYGSMPAIVVTATTRDDTKAPYATGPGNARWGMAAPGGYDDDPDDEDASGLILSTGWRNLTEEQERDGEDPHTYAYGAGTSMAAPHVAGAATVLRGLGLSPEQTVDRLLETAEDLGPPGRDSSTGHGRLDLAAATEGFPDGDGLDAQSTGQVSSAPTRQSPEPDPEPPSQPAPQPSPTAGSSAPPTTAPGREPTRTSEATTPSTSAPPTSSSTPASRTEPTGGPVPLAAPDPGPGGGDGVGPWAVAAGVLLGIVLVGVRHVLLLPRPATSRSRR